MRTTTSTITVTVAVPAEADIRSQHWLENGVRENVWNTNIRFSTPRGHAVAELIY